jgi:predicted dehydrogenase
MANRAAFEATSERLDRRKFINVVGAGSLVAAASAAPGLAASLEKPPAPRLDPGAPLRIGMIGRTGHLGYVLNQLDTVPKARIAAYAFEDGDWTFNSDGSRRSDGNSQGTSYNMDRQRRWVDGQAWSKMKPTLYETYQEMLEKEELDLAVICLPYARNALAICAAAEAGLDILSEKPVAVNRSDLDRVERTVKSTGVRLSAMFAMRYASPIYTVWRTVGQGEIGKPCLARAQKSYKWGDGRPWFYKDKEIYGSTILWVGIHAVDYLRWCTGLEVRRVSGFHSNLAHPESPDAQDNAVISLELENGATAAITMDYLRPETAPTHGDDRIRIAGSKGIVESFSDEDTVELVTGEKKPHEIKLEEPELPLFADFVGELRGQRTSLIGPDEAVRVTRICIAATEAAEKQHTIAV